MMASASRAIMALAVHMLGGGRREWGLAMQAEFEAAREDGEALRFAAGCLVAACGELPRHEEGRFALASHALALAVIVPVAALMVASVLIGFPGSYFGGGQEAPLNDGNRSAVFPLVMLVLGLAVLKLRIAWLALDRDWARLMGVGALSAAGTATLVIFSAVAFADPGAALAQAGAVTVELTALSALARWHGGLSHSGLQTG
jgi:hypothetical protein